MADRLIQRRWLGYRDLLRNRAATAALEFGLLAPVLTMVLLATIELSDVIRVQAKLNIAAGQLVEMIAAQSTVVSASTSTLSSLTASLSDMCAGAALNLLPFDNAAMSANIASISVYLSNGVAYPTLDWNTETACQTPATHMAAASIGYYSNAPQSLLTADGVSWNGGNNSDLVPGYSAIVVQVNYQYTNVLPYFLSQYVNMTAVAVARPRSNTTIPCTTTPIGSANPVYCPQNP